MAKGPREIIRNRLSASINAVAKVREYLMANGEMYRADGHGDIVSQYEVVYSFAQELENLLVGLRGEY